MRYYLAGINGDQMTNLALLLSNLGYEVDLYADEYYEDERLLNNGLKFFLIILNLDENCIVVYTNLEENHRVFLKAKELNLKVYDYSVMIEKLVKKFDTICISGIHGKTTVSNILKEVIDSSYIIDNRAYGNKESNKFILEEEKLDRDYEPEYVVITSMETNTTDNYNTVDDMINKYQEFANKASKMVIACGDDPYTHTLSVNTQMFYYGLNEDNDITARDVEYSESGTIFDVYVEDEYYGHFELPIFGKYMLLDVLAVISVCHYERMDAKEVHKILKEYNYLNKLEDGSNIIVEEKVSDEIELKAVIKGLKQKYPNKKILIVNYNNDVIDDVEYISSKDIKLYNDSVIIKVDRK